MNPTVGKIDIDYDTLHDAIFRYSTKPRMTGHGEIYHEGKEDEVKFNTFKPGKISDSLRVIGGSPVTSSKLWGYRSMLHPLG